MYLNVKGRRIMAHRHIMEQHLGRPLKPFPQEVVHHINGNRSDNRLENLVVLAHGVHVSQHQTGQKYTEERKQNISKAKRQARNKP